MIKNMKGFITKKNVIRLSIVAVVAVIIFFIAREAKAPDQSALLFDAKNTPAASIPAVDPASIGRVVKDPATGKEFMSNQIIVEFNATVAESDALTLISDEKGKMLQRFTKVPLFLVQIKDTGDGSGARKAILEFKKDTRVKNADLNFLTTN